MKLNRVMTLMACGAAALTLAACKESGTAQSSAPAPASTTYVLASMPEGAMDVGEAKKSVKEGESVKIRGRIGGRAKPMSENVALFIMMDPAIPSCADGDDDHCPIPWDYCCETPETIMANSVTVQVMGGDGSVLPVNLAEQAGLEPLDEVIVVGTVGPRPNDGALVIYADGLYKVGG